MSTVSEYRAEHPWFRIPQQNISKKMYIFQNLLIPIDLKLISVYQSNNNNFYHVAISEADAYVRVIDMTAGGPGGGPGHPPNGPLTIMPLLNLGQPRPG